MSVFGVILVRIRTEDGEVRSISPYSVRMWENADQTNSEYGHFLRSDTSPLDTGHKLNVHKMLAKGPGRPGRSFVVSVSG